MLKRACKSFGPLEQQFSGITTKVKRIEILKDTLGQKKDIVTVG